MKYLRKDKSARKDFFWGAAGLGLVLLILLAILLLRSCGGGSHAAPTEATRPAPRENPYTEQDFTRDESGFLHCGAAKTAIDVSEHQREIDWDKVKAAGIDLAVIRIGYRGYDKGGIHADSHAEENLGGAEAAGLAVGAYFFSQAVSPEEAAEEAEFVLGMIKGRKLTGPVVFDWEPVGDPEARTADMTGQTLTDCALAFCKTIENAGYRAGVYFNQYQANSMYRLSELTDYVLWLAMYEDAMTFPYAMDLWQYSCEGIVDGIELPVDLNLWFDE